MVRKNVYAAVAWFLVYAAVAWLHAAPSQSGSPLLAQQQHLLA
jgi:hypothetical protein